MTIKRMDQVTVVVDDLPAAAQYEDQYRLCYLRGPAGIIVALAGELL